MKKLLAILVSVCLIAVSGLSAFAVSESDDYNVSDTANDVIDSIIIDGAKTDDEILDVADHLYNDTYIDQDVYNEIYRIIENGLREDINDGSNENEDIINAITEIIEDDSLDVVAKISAVVDLLKGLPAEEVQSILDELLAADVIDEATYTAISDALNGSSSILGGIDNETGSPISGIGDFLSGILEMIGIGGGGSGDNDDTSSNNGSTPSDASTNSSDFEGSGAKTGDYAVASVAGVAVAAGLVLVLTHAKKDENND